MATSSNYTYTATGSEGTSLTVVALIAQAVLLCFVGDKNLKYVLSAPAPGEYTFDSSTGIITVGVALQANQVIQVIYRPT